MKKLIAALLIISNIIFAQSAGNTGLSFLKVGSDARNVALSDLGVVGINDITALNYNPAQLTKITSPQLSFAHNKFFEDAASEIFSAGFLAFGFPVVIGINTTSISNIEVREKPGPAVSTFDAHYFMGSLSSAYKIGKKFSIGFSAKYLYENLFTEDATGFGLDFGATYFNLIDGLELGASIKNLGSMNKLKNESTKLPQDFRIGAAYSIEAASAKTVINFIGGFQKYVDTEDNHLHIGAEGIYDGFLSVRAGYATGYDSKSFTAGVGVKWQKFNFDYAYVPFLRGLGDSQIISLAYSF